MKELGFDGATLDNLVAGATANTADAKPRGGAVTKTTKVD
jgi:hypothetical protein